MADFTLLTDFITNLTANEVSDSLKQAAHLTNHRGNKDFADDIFAKSFEHFIKIAPTDPEQLNKLSKHELEKLLHRVSSLAFVFANDYVTKVRSAEVCGAKDMERIQEHNLRYATSKTGKVRKKAAPARKKK